MGVCLGNHPLQDAGVFPAGGEQAAVIVQEGNVGHVTAVATVLVTRSLEGGGEKVLGSEAMNQRSYKNY